MNWEALSLDDDELVLRIETNFPVPADQFGKFIVHHVQKIREPEFFGEAAIVELVEAGQGSIWVKLKVSKENLVIALTVSAFAMQLHDEYCNDETPLTSHIADILIEYSGVAIQIVSKDFKSEVTKNEIAAVLARIGEGGNIDENWRVGKFTTSAKDKIQFIADLEPERKFGVRLPKEHHALSVRKLIERTNGRARVYGIDAHPTSTSLIDESLSIYQVIPLGRKPITRTSNVISSVEGRTLDVWYGGSSCTVFALPQCRGFLTYATGQGSSGSLSLKIVGWKLGDEVIAENVRSVR